MTITILPFLIEAFDEVLTLWRQCGGEAVAGTRVIHAFLAALGGLKRPEGAGEKSGNKIF